MKIDKLSDTNSQAVLRERTFGRLGCIADGGPYVVPVNYIFDGKDIYIHSLPGKKINALRANPRICLQVDQIIDSYHWRSVIAYGNYEEIFEEKARTEILENLSSNLPDMSPVESKMVDGLKEIIIFRIKVDEITGIIEDW
jgi:nitroimidazol reductase NimA-like FMN-containing flavoprotein (pyridoxamine 5'-phosphate oxidase superfamily)